MKLLMHVLKANKKLDIDNEEIELMNALDKLEEEQKEVVEATVRYKSNKSISNLVDVVAETFDLIQVCILMLWKCYKEGKELGYEDVISDTNISHKDKLINRGWIPFTGIEIDIKE